MLVEYAGGRGRGRGRTVRSHRRRAVGFAVSAFYMRPVGGTAWSGGGGPDRQATSAAEAAALGSGRGMYAAACSTGGVVGVPAKGCMLSSRACAW